MTPSPSPSLDRCAGMCCALNQEAVVRESPYGLMVSEMQGPEAGGRHKVPVTVGKKEGLRLTLDLHSNQASFGSVNEDYNAFRVYLGGPSEFPVLQERSLSLEPGQEHSLELTAKAGTPALLAPGSCAPGSCPRSWLLAPLLADCLASGDLLLAWHPGPRPPRQEMLLLGRGQPRPLLHLHLHKLQALYSPGTLR